MSQFCVFAYIYNRFFFSGIQDNWHTDPGDGGHLEIDKIDLDRVKRDDSGMIPISFQFGNVNI